MASLSAIIQKLQSLRRAFDARAARLKLAALRGVRLDKAMPSELAALHEELLFLCAYPDHRAVGAAAERGLRSIARRIRGTALADELRNSGIADTPLRATFSSDLLKWLDARFGKAVRPAWDADSLGGGFDELLSLLVEPAEIDGLQQEHVSTREWLRAARGAMRELQWMTDRLERAFADVRVRDALLEHAEIPIIWPALPFHVSRSGLRFPRREPHFHADLLRDVSLQEWLNKPLPRAEALTLSRRRELIDIARLVLATRERETDPVTYADEREVTLFRLERGVDVALFGMQPSRRLPVESYFGFVAAKNRVPIAYGGGWVFFDRCEIGVNLFETFRGGESSLIFSQVMRVYRHFYRASRFTVAPYQFGADNEEAIQSGAYWFYHRLGFRSADARLRRLAEREIARITAGSGHRTPPATLRRFTKAPLEMTVASDFAARDANASVDLARVSFAITRQIGRQFGGNVEHATRHMNERLRDVVGLDPHETNGAVFTVGERALRFLFASLPNAATWPRADREALLHILRAKSGPRERDYALLVQNHPRLRESLVKLATRG